jgi:Flp pilus assembly protein TadG
MRRNCKRLLNNEQAAVAPTVALALFALIAAGGIAFDYARVASMDTELQNAADQAALAAASQLDGQAGACARAAAAANALLANNTLFANDAEGKAVAVDNENTCDADDRIRFYQSYNQVTDTPGAAATTDAEAKVVIVAVNPREAFYALTPVVGALRSGPIGAEAVASLGSAICKMPPVMICNPDEVGGNLTFDPALYVGKGLRLTSVGTGGGWVPGNFGYLDTNVTEVSGQVNQLRAALGWDTPPGECIVADGVDTKPGATVTVTDAINTRFDILQNQNTSCWGSGTCSPSVNSTKDFARPANANGNNACAFNPQGWQLPTGYYGSGSYPVAGSTPAALPTTATPSSMGYPRDMCHAVSSAGSCVSGYNGRIGDGAWDRDAYFRVNYRRSDGTYWTAGTGTGSWQANTGLSPTVTPTIPGTNSPNPNYASRYNVYLWEIAHRTQSVDGVTVLGPRIVSGSGANAMTAYGAPQCGTGALPGATTPDRRRISVAVVNCQANSVNGNSSGVPVEKWIDVFLVEPSANRERTSDGDVYAEVIAEVQSGGNGTTNAQVIKHDVPYLIR